MWKDIRYTANTEKRMVDSKVNGGHGDRDHLEIVTVLKEDQDIKLARHTKVGRLQKAKKVQMHKIVAEGCGVLQISEFSTVTGT